jgi:hypothetical protein
MLTGIVYTLVAPLSSLWRSTMPQWEYRELIDPTTMEMTAAGDDRWECFAVAALHPRERGLLYIFKRPRQEASAAEPPLAALRRFATVKEKEALSLAGNEKAEKDANYHYGRHDAFARMLYEIDVLEGAQP